MHEVIRFERGWIKSDKVKDLLKKGSHLVIITDDKVASLYGENLKTILKADLITFPSGEKSKTRETKAKIEDELFALGVGRDGILIALGGGVVTDLVGFIAATYCRGIPYISIPTTLLGMVDASVGGKTGVNLPGGKNMIGAFYPPLEVIMDIDVLNSLQETELRNGMAEIIKYGAIWDKALFHELSEVKDLLPLIKKSVEIKEDIVKKDPKETGLRSILNFGHTIGHAIETLEDYSLSHGEAVAIGMIGEAHLTGHEAPLITLIEKFQFPLKLSSKVTAEALFTTMKKDKKALNKTAHFVLLEEIGKVLSPKPLPIENDHLLKTLNWLIQWIHSR